MKVVAFNGSPRKRGNVATGLEMMKENLAKEGIELEIVNVVQDLSKTIKGCSGCAGCFKMMNKNCVIKDDADIKSAIEKVEQADGVLLASPVYFSGINGEYKAFLDRLFFVAMANGSTFKGKVAASFAAVRRSGGIPAIQQLNHYLSYTEMLLTSSNYWTVVHGLMPGEVKHDAEGEQILEVLAKNMAYNMKLVENGRGKVEEPALANKIMTNMVRKDLKN